jgi:hypothetical protein
MPDLVAAAVIAVSHVVVKAKTAVRTIRVIQALVAMTQAEADARRVKPAGRLAKPAVQVEIVSRGWVVLHKRQEPLEFARYAVKLARLAVPTTPLVRPG